MAECEVNIGKTDLGEKLNIGPGKKKGECWDGRLES